MCQPCVWLLLCKQVCVSHVYDCFSVNRYVSATCIVAFGCKQVCVSHVYGCFCRRLCVSDVYRCVCKQVCVSHVYCCFSVNRYDHSSFTDAERRKT